MLVKLLNKNRWGYLTFEILVVCIIRPCSIHSFGLFFFFVNHHTYLGSISTNLNFSVFISAEQVNESFHLLKVQGLNCL